MTTTHALRLALLSVYLALPACGTVTTAAGIAATADTVKGAIDSAKALDAGVTPSLRVQAKTARAYFVATVSAVVADFPPCTATSVGGAFTSMAVNADAAFTAYLEALRPPVPHTAQRKALPKRHKDAIEVLRAEWQAELRHPRTVHTASLSGVDIAGIVSAVLGGAAALAGAGEGIAQAVKSSGSSTDVATCQAAVAAMREDAAGLQAAFAADDAKP